MQTFRCCCRRATREICGHRYAKTLAVQERRQILRLLVKEILVGSDTLPSGIRFPLLPATDLQQTFLVLFPPDNPAGANVKRREQPGNVAPISPRYRDRKSTRLNSSHGYISYAVFCLKKKK